MMKLTVKAAIAAVLCAAPVLLHAAALSAGPAGEVDLILANAKVKTPAGWAESVAVRDGVIVAVGTGKEVGALRAKGTRVLDLKGATLLPGLQDLHVHPLFAGLGEIACRISQGSTLAQTQQKVKECVANAPSGKWITGGQWDASALGQVPNRGLLDAAAPSNPMLLDDTSGHSAWVNTKALELAGITRDTPNPEGGIIERDAAGEATGVLRELAVNLVRKHVPPATEAEVRTALKWSMHEMLSYGITGFTEASVGFSAGLRKELDAYAAMADAGEIRQRARLCITWAPGNAEAEAMIAARNLYARDRVRPDCVKIFLDGVPTDGHTAAMLEPYEGTLEGRDDAASRSGMLLVKQTALNEAVTRFDRMGLTVKFHAAGDAAVRAGIDAIAAARTANGISGQLHDVGHCTFVAAVDIARARDIGATFEVSPYLWGPTPINDDITKAVGATRIERVWPVREMIASGALVVPGSDWAVVPSVNPWIGLETLVTREVPGGSPDSFGKKEGITLEQAFTMYTESAAQHIGMADRLGRIEPGMLADLIVVEKDPFAVPITEVHKTRVRMSFVGGELVYEAGK